MELLVMNSWATPMGNLPVGRVGLIYQWVTWAIP